MLAGRSLQKLKENFPHVEIVEIDVVTNPLRAWQDGIRFIPALRSDNKIISGILLSEKQINTFLTEL